MERSAISSARNRDRVVAIQAPRSRRTRPMMEAKAPDAIVRYEVSEKVARITLARPPANALSLEMIRALVAAVRRAADDRAARVVVLASAIPKRFSAGLDLDLLLGKSSEEIRPFLQELYIGLYDAQWTLGKPSIA